MVRSPRDRRSRRSQFELQYLNEIIESLQKKTGRCLNMQFYAQERLEYGVDSEPVTSEQRLQSPDMERFHADADKRSDLSETDDLSVPLSASLYGDYSYIYDEYLD